MAPRHPATDECMPALELLDITKQYAPGAARAVDAVSLAVQKGEILSLLSAPAAVARRLRCA